jgi:exodeoxyribonuclease VII large subunit
VSREVRHDGVGAFHVRFPFDRNLVDLVKTLPNRRWNANERFWWVPEQDVVDLVELLEPHSFRFDSATRKAYTVLGGTLSLDESDPSDSTSPRLPGLFDEDDKNAAPTAGATDDFTISRLNQRVKQVIENAFPQAVWLVGEISGFNRSAHKRHVGFQLVEKEDDGKTISSIDSTLFERERQTIERALSQAGEPFRLEDEITVRVRVRVQLYVPWGSYRVLVEELDVHYTLGEAARRREEILRRLSEAGLVGLNAALPMPALPLRVGLVTSLGSDAYNDVLRTLQDSGYAFHVVAHGARVQGHATEASVLNALDALRDRADSLDVVIICRGGGSRTDLAWFDSEALGRAVARFPLPIVVGIGHEQDFCVLDEIGRRCKTPTAAATFVVEAVRRQLEAIEGLRTDLLGLAARQLTVERRRGGEWGRRLGLAAGGLVERERVQLEHRRARASRGARVLVAAARERMMRLVRGIPRAGGIELARQRSFLDHAARTVSQAAGRDIAAAGQRVDEVAGWISPRVRRFLGQASERTAQRGRRLDLVDPRRVLERGYAILRAAEGSVLQDAGLAPAGTSVSAQLKRGSLQLRSEGPVNEQGGD